MAEVVLLSLVRASVALALSETALCAGLRERVKARSAWLGRLACCGDCLAHRVAFGFMAVYRPRLSARWWLLDWLCTALFIAWLAAFQRAAMC
jgi:hypothetical protein